jgi:uncharacterized membrane protein required for colicin V production
MNGLHGLDYAIIGAAAFGALYGASRGVLRMVTSATSLVAAVYCAAQYHSAGAAIAQTALGPSVGSTVIAVLGYVAVFAIVFAGVEAAGNILIRLFQIVHLSWADRLGGGLLGSGVAVVIAGLGVLLLTALPSSGVQQLLRESMLAPHVLAYNHALVGYVPVEIRDAYQVRHDELIQYWLQHPIVPGTSASPAPTSAAASASRG